MYVCRAKNYFGVAEKSVQVSVAKGTKIKAPDGPIMVHLGQPITLYCKFTVDPMLEHSSVEVKWSKDKHTIEAEEQSNLHLEKASKVSCKVDSSKFNSEFK